MWEVKGAKCPCLNGFYVFAGLNGPLIDFSRLTEYWLVLFFFLHAAFGVILACHSRAPEFAISII